MLTNIREGLPNAIPFVFVDAGTMVNRVCCFNNNGRCDGGDYCGMLLHILALRLRSGRPPQASINLLDGRKILELN